MHQLLPGLDHLPQLTHATTHCCRVSLRKCAHVLGGHAPTAGRASQKVRTPQSEKSSNRGPQMIFLMNCDKSLPRIRGGLFPSRSETLVRSTRSLEVRGSLLGMCSHQGPDNVIAAAPWRTACVFTVCIGGLGVSQAAPKTLDAGSGQCERVAFGFARTTHLDPLGIRNGRSELPSPGGENSILSMINFLLSYLRLDLTSANAESMWLPGLRAASPGVDQVHRPRAGPASAPTFSTRPIETNSGRIQNWESCFIAMVQYGSINATCS